LVTRRLRGPERRGLEGMGTEVLPTVGELGSEVPRLVDELDLCGLEGVGGSFVLEGVELRARPLPFLPVDLGVKAMTEQQDRRW